MFQRIFVEDYFKNPFFWWGIFILSLITFHAHPISFSILKTIIFQQLYVPVQYGLFSLLFFISFYPIQISLTRLYYENNEKLESLLYFGLLGLMLIIHVVFIVPDAMIIFSKLQPQVITNQTVFKETVDLKTIFEFIGIPLLYAFSLSVVKRALSRRFLEINDKIRNNWKLGILTISIGIFAYLSHIIQQNPWQ